MLFGETADPLPLPPVKHNPVTKALPHTCGGCTLGTLLLRVVHSKMPGAVRHDDTKEFGDRGTVGTAGEGWLLSSSGDTQQVHLSVRPLGSLPSAKSIRFRATLIYLSFELPGCLGFRSRRKLMPPPSPSQRGKGKQNTQGRQR